MLHLHRRSLARGVPEPRLEIYWRRCFPFDLAEHPCMFESDPKLWAFGEGGHSLRRNRLFGKVVSTDRLRWEDDSEVASDAAHLSVTNATMAWAWGDPSQQQKVVVITIRPDEGSFRPHNISVSREQAHRLWEDLGSASKRSSLGVLLGFLLLRAVGVLSLASLPVWSLASACRHTSVDGPSFPSPSTHCAVSFTVMCPKSFCSSTLSIVGVSDKEPEPSVLGPERSQFNRRKSINNNSLRFLANCL